MAQVRYRTQNLRVPVSRSPLGVLQRRPRKQPLQHVGTLGGLLTDTVHGVVDPHDEQGADPFGHLHDAELELIPRDGARPGRVHHIQDAEEILGGIVDAFGFEERRDLGQKPQDLPGVGSIRPWLVLVLRWQLVEQLFARQHQQLASVLSLHALLLHAQVVLVEHALADHSSEQGNHAKTAEDDERDNEHRHARAIPDNVFVVFQCRGRHNLEQGEHRNDDRAKFPVQELRVRVIVGGMADRPHQNNRAHVEDEEHQKCHPRDRDSG
mmetsp:Transcript_36159/g.104038  ORF Transcript_36159/g.104038 Transcript_36159/m.104038 type:complete len:267 (-) Transcript_36159:993-1793(-)